MGKVSKAQMAAAGIAAIMSRFYPKRNSTTIGKAAATATGSKRKRSRTKTKVAVKKPAKTYKSGQSSAPGAKYVGPFKKAKTQKRSKAVAFDKYGSVYKREHHFITQAIECAYIGHGFPTHQAFTAAVRAIVRSLLEKAGIGLSDWNDQLNIIGLVSLVYTKGRAGAPTDTTIPVAITDSALSIATALATDIQADISNSDALDSVNYLDVSLRLTIGANTINVATINLKNYQLYFDYWSILKVKNVSLASDATDGDQIDNVEAVALTGRTYRTNKWMNGFYLDRRTANNTKDGTIFADIDNGTISNTGANYSTTDTVGNPYNKPPPAYMLGTDKTAHVKMNPGELKTDKIFWRASMGWNTYINKCIFQANTSLDAAVRPIGVASMLALEKQVEIGTQTSSSIRLAGQVDYVLKVRGRAFTGKAPPLVHVLDS